MSSTRKWKARRRKAPVATVKKRVVQRRAVVARHPTTLTRKTVPSAAARPTKKSQVPVPRKPPTLKAAVAKPQTRRKPLVYVLPRQRSANLRHGSVASTFTIKTTKKARHKKEQEQHRQKQAEQYFQRQQYEAQEQKKKQQQQLQYLLKQQQVAAKQLLKQQQEQKKKQQLLKHQHEQQQKVAAHQLLKQQHEQQQKVAAHQLLKQQQEQQQQFAAQQLLKHQQEQQQQFAAQQLLKHQQEQHQKVAAHQLLKQQQEQEQQQQFAAQSLVKQKEEEQENEKKKQQQTQQQQVNQQQQRQKQEQAILVPGFTVKWLEEEGLLKPIPVDSICQGCYIPRHSIVNFVEKWCKRCEAAHAKTVKHGEISVQLNRETGIALHPAELSKNVQVSLPLVIAKALQNAGLESYNSLVIIPSGYTGHQSALFVYLSPQQKTVDIRFFNPQEQQNSAVEKVQQQKRDTTEAVLSAFLPAYLKNILPDFTLLGIDFGHACPVGLQVNEFNDQTQWKRMKELGKQLAAKELELKQIQPMLDAAQLKHTQLAAELIERKKTLQPNQKQQFDQDQQKYYENLTKLQELGRRYNEIAEEEYVLATERGSLNQKAIELEEKSHKQSQCYVIPRGFCEAWTAIVSLVHIAFPLSNVDAIASDLFHNFKSVPGLVYLQDLIKRFSYNLYEQTIDPNAEYEKPCCRRNDVTPIDIKARCKK